jgi:hypothetical protein
MMSRPWSIFQIW